MIFGLFSLFKKEHTSKQKGYVFCLFPSLCFTAGDVAMACGIRSAGESCILTSQYPQGLAAWQSGVQRAPPSADWFVPPESKSKKVKGQCSWLFYEHEMREDPFRKQFSEALGKSDKFEKY